MCSTAAHRGQWMDRRMPDVRMSLLLTTDGLPGLLCAALFALLIIIFSPMLLMPSMQSGLAGAILYASVFLLGAMLWSWQRARLAELLDQDDPKCLNCRASLKTVDTDRGLGTCPECGMDFARFPGEPDDEMGTPPETGAPAHA